MVHVKVCQPGDDDLVLSKHWLEENVLRKAGRRIPLLSNEGIVACSAERRKRRAENLRALFGPCKVVVTLRQPFDLVESLYFQKLKTGKDFGCRSMEDWLEDCQSRPAGGPLVNLDYARTVDIYSEVFGRQSVGIFLFEQLAQDFGKYVTALCEFIGIGSDEGVALATGKHENPRISPERLHRLETIAESPVLSRTIDWLPKKIRRRLSRPKGKSEGANLVRAPLSKLWEERIAEMTRDGNRQLMKDWNLPLEAYGYPV
jgi:hypothetical protein